MRPEEIESIIQRAISEGLQFPWWLYIVAVVAPFVGAYFGTYFKKKAENLATKEDYESLLVQLKKTTAETEGIKVELAKGTWLHQQRWNLKEKYYSGLLDALYTLKLSFSVRLDRYIEQGSEYRDNEIMKSEYFKSQLKIGTEALDRIQQLHGPAQMVISKRAIEALERFYSSDWNASNFSACNKEYLDEVYESVEEAHKIMLEEARSELR